MEHFNVACIVENMLLSATNLGLGSIYLTTFLTEMLKREDIIKKLEINSEYIPLSAVGVGYIDKSKNVHEQSAQNIINRIEVIRK